MDNPEKLSPLYTLTRKEGYFRTTFSAMASPCELLIDSTDEKLAVHLSDLAVGEVKRIENKFSRYRHDNLCYRINNAQGQKVTIDEEYFRLLSFADTCYSLSSGMFDISSGILRRIWRFDGGNKIPSQKSIDELLPLIGWQKVTFNEESIHILPNMEIDFGGIGKEYAVSRVADICREHAENISVLVNLGGDIEVTCPRIHEPYWTVGVEDAADALERKNTTSGVLTIRDGALATSGDTKRYLLKNGKRYSHILNPKTGWPISNAPSSVTVAAQVCIQAGCLATIALLQGKKAEAFLQNQDAKYWCDRA